MTAAAASVLLTACSTLPDQPNFSSSLVLPVGRDQNNARVYTAPQYVSRIQQPNPQTCVDFDAETSPSVTQRNSCILELKTDIDAAYQQYEIDINNAIARTNSAFDTAALLAGTAAPVTSGTAAKVLSSVAAVANGGKKIFSEDVLYKATMQILISTMVADRAKDAANLRLSMQETLNQYPIQQAKNDLLDYLYAGTLTHALAEASQNASAVAQKCQAADSAVKDSIAGGVAGNAKKIQAAAAPGAAPPGGEATTSDQCNQITNNIKAAYSYTGPGKTLETFWKPNGIDFDERNEAAIKSCMKSAIDNPSGDEKALIETGDISSLTNTAIFSDADKVKILICAITASAKQNAAVKPAK